MDKAISWFEIPATDLDRAQKFYETILNIKLNRTSMGGEELGIFPYDREGGATGGALIGAGSEKPSTDGTVLYLHSKDDIATVLECVPAAGGRVTKGRIELLNGIGAIAWIADTEGNRVGVHAMK